jgi:NADP-dependent 3-hydroxy acid dehydrogenase YdfG
MGETTAIVTAASTGIGAACARELRARGYQLSLLARSDAVLDLARELSGIATVGSVTDPEALERLVRNTLDAFGRIDVVVNNTGHPAKGDLLAVRDAEWHDGLDLLLLSVVRMARLVTPVFEQQGGGVMVNISSFAAQEPSLPRPGVVRPSGGAIQFHDDVCAALRSTEDPNELSAAGVGGHPRGGGGGRR